MWFDQGTVVFKSKSGSYEAEKQDTKNWTIRFLDRDQYVHLRKYKPKRIRIEKRETQGKECFERTLRDVRDLGTLLGKTLVALTWNPPTIQQEIPELS